MKTTINNYFDRIKPVNTGTLPVTLAKGHDLAVKSSTDGSWKMYHGSETIKRVLDLYFEQLDSYLSEQKTAARRTAPTGHRSRSGQSAKAKTADKPKVAAGHRSRSGQSATTRSTTAKKKLSVKAKSVKKPTKKSKKPAVQRPARKAARQRTAKKPDTSKKVSALSSEVKIIRRIINLHDKVVSSKQIENVVKALQRMIVRKEIRKTSPYAGEIRDLQNLLINFHNGMKGTTEKFSIPDALYKKVAPIAKDEKVRESVRLINRYITLLNSDDVPAIKRLRTSILNALKKRIASSDPYYKQLKKVEGKLDAVINTSQRLEATASELSGLQDILAKYDLKVPKMFRTASEKKKSGSNGLGNIDKSDIQKAIARRTVNAMKVVRDTIKGFTSSDTLHKDVSRQVETFSLPGEIGELLGDLERYKLAMTLEGEQGSGKTRFVYQLADAFIDSGFTVGNFSLEIGDKSKIVKDMIEQYLKVKNRPDYHITAEAAQGIDSIRKYAKDFDVIIIDSWNKLDADSSEFDKLRNDFPNTIWIVIFQRTTQGTIRGGTRPLYDAGINLEAVKSDKGFAYNYVHSTKNRYGETYRKYYVDSQSFQEPIEVKQTTEA